MLLKRIKLITWLYLLILVLGSVLPLNSGVTLNNTYVVEVRSDYLLHALIMSPMTVLLGLSLRNRAGIWAKVFVLGMLIVIFCETIQMLIPYRTFNINDLFANGVGAFIGLIPAVFVWRRFSDSVRSAHLSKG